MTSSVTAASAATWQTSVAGESRVATGRATTDGCLLFFILPPPRVRTDPQSQTPCRCLVSGVRSGSSVDDRWLLLCSRPSFILSLSLSLVNVSFLLFTLAHCKDNPMSLLCPCRHHKIDWLLDLMPFPTIGRHATMRLAPASHLCNLSTTPWSVTLHPLPAESFCAIMSQTQPSLWKFSPPLTHN